MKVSSTALFFLSFSCLNQFTTAFTPTSYITNQKYRTISPASSLAMALDMPDTPKAPPASDNIPVLQKSRGGAPVDVRYSDFLKLVNGDRVEKVTFSSDGTKLLGVDVEGVRLKIESLPNDPSLLNSLTEHKVRINEISLQFQIIGKSNSSRVT